MGYLDSVVMPGGAAKPTVNTPTPKPASSGGYLSSVVMPKDPVQATKIIGLQKDAAQSVVDSKKANSTGTIVKETFGGLKDAAVNGAREYAKESADTVIPFGKAVVGAITHPITTAKKVAAVYNKPLTESLNGAKESVDSMISDYQNGTGSKAGDVKNLLNTALNVGGALFSPIAGAFNVAEKIPGAKQVADTANAAVGAVGKIGSYTFGKAIDLTPTSILPQHAKDIIKPTVENVGSFAAQILLGDRIIKGVTDRLKLGEPITPEVTNKIVEEAKKDIPAKHLEQKTPVAEWSSDPKIQSDLIDKKNTEQQPAAPKPLTDEEKRTFVSTDKEGKKVQQEFIKTGTEGEKASPELRNEVMEKIPPKEGFDVIYKPFGEHGAGYYYSEAEKPVVATETTPAEPSKLSTAASRAEADNKPVKTGNESVESKSVSIDQMKEHLNPKEFEEFKNSTSHEKASRAEQVTKAQSFVNDYKDKTDGIIFKGEHPPEGIRTQDVFTEARIKALEDYKAGTGTLDDYLKYVKADELLGSRSGSELGARANRFDKNDPASWLQKAREVLQKSDIRFGKEKTVKAVDVEKEVKKMTASVRKTRATLIDYQSIIDTITC